MATYYSSPPQLEQLKPEDVIFYNNANNVNFQTPQIQELFKQGAITGWQDPLKPGTGDIGVKIIKPYVNPNTLPNLSPTGDLADAQSKVLSSGQPSLDTIKDDLLNTQQNALNQGKYQSTDVNGNAYWADVNPSVFAPETTTTATTNIGLSIKEQTDKFLADQLANTKAQIESAAKQSIQRTEDIAGRTSGALRRTLAKGGGISGTAAGQALATQDSVLQQNIQEIEDKKQQLISQAQSDYQKGMLSNMQAYQESLQKLEEAQYKQKQDQINNYFKALSAQNQQKQMDISTLNALTNIPEGKSVTINGTTYTGLKKPTIDTQLVKNELTGDSQLVNMDTGEVISTIKGTGASAEQEMVLDMATSYKDAGILPTDTLESATAKLKGSKIYAQQTRLAGGGGGGGQKQEEQPITFQSAMEDTAKYLVDLRNSGKLSDLNYKQAINAFMADFGFEPTEYANVASAINKLMEGGNINQQQITQAPKQTFALEDEIGSDFTSRTFTTRSSTPFKL